MVPAVPQFDDGVAPHVELGQVGDLGVEVGASLGVSASDCQISAFVSLVLDDVVKDIIPLGTFVLIDFLAAFVEHEGGRSLNETGFGYVSLLVDIDLHHHDAGCQFLSVCVELGGNRLRVRALLCGKVNNNKLVLVGCCNQFI